MDDSHSPVPGDGLDPMETNSGAMPNQNETENFENQNLDIDQNHENGEILNEISTDNQIVQNESNENIENQEKGIIDDNSKQETNEANNQNDAEIQISNKTTTENSENLAQSQDKSGILNENEGNPDGVAQFQDNNENISEKQRNGGEPSIEISIQENVTENNEIPENQQNNEEITFQENIQINETIESQQNIEENNIQENSQNNDNTQATEDTKENSTLIENTDTLHINIENEESHIINNNEDINENRENTESTNQTISNQLFDEIENKTIADLKENSINDIQGTNIIQSDTLVNINNTDQIISTSNIDDTIECQSSEHINNNTEKANGININDTIPQPEPGNVPNNDDENSQPTTPVNTALSVNEDKVSLEQSIQNNQLTPQNDSSLNKDLGISNKDILLKNENDPEIASLSPPLTPPNEPTSQSESAILEEEYLTSLEDNNTSILSILQNSLCVNLFRKRNPALCKRLGDENGIIEVLNIFQETDNKQLIFKIFTLFTSANNTLLNALSNSPKSFDIIAKIFQNKECFNRYRIGLILEVIEKAFNLWNEKLFQIFYNKPNLWSSLLQAIDIDCVFKALVSFLIQGDLSFLWGYFKAFLSPNKPQKKPPEKWNVKQPSVHNCASQSLDPQQKGRLIEIFRFIIIMRPSEKEFIDAITAEIPKLIMEKPNRNEILLIIKLSLNLNNSIPAVMDKCLSILKTDDVNSEMVEYSTSYVKLFFHSSNIMQMLLFASRCLSRCHNDFVFKELIKLVEQIFKKLSANRKFLRNVFQNLIALNWNRRSPLDICLRTFFIQLSCIIGYVPFISGWRQFMVKVVRPFTKENSYKHNFRFNENFLDFGLISMISAGLLIKRTPYIPFSQSVIQMKTLLDLNQSSVYMNTKANNMKTIINGNNKAEIDTENSQAQTIKIEKANNIQATSEESNKAEADIDEINNMKNTTEEVNNQEIGSGQDKSTEVNSEEICESKTKTQTINNTDSKNEEVNSTQSNSNESKHLEINTKETNIEKINNSNAEQSTDKETNNREVKLNATTSIEKNDAEKSSNFVKTIQNGKRITRSNSLIRIYPIPLLAEIYKPKKNRRKASSSKQSHKKSHKKRKSSRRSSGKKKGCDIS